MDFDDSFGYEENIPENIREVFMWLCQDFVSLKMLWIFYHGLFGKKEDSELLAGYATESFRIIEESLRISMVMAIARFNDPSIQKNKQNLSFDIIVQNCSQIEGLIELYENFKEASTPFVIFRNKSIGHRDLNKALDYEAISLPVIGKKEVERVLSLASKLLNLVALHYSDSEFNFDAHSIGGAEQLLYWFKLGIKSQEVTQ